jgi:hypothetical protein
VNKKKSVMANLPNKILRDGYERLKKTLEKIIKPEKEETRPQLVLQPIRNQPPGNLSGRQGR